MIELLLAATKGYEPLRGIYSSQKSGESSGQERNVAMWKILLTQALEEECLALIDTGALLAGIAMHEATQFLIQHKDFNVSGVTYYDTRKRYDCWVVLERERQVLRPLKASSVHERDTFVIFDEARSRGSDMKLLPDAVALLTLGPTISKDKLMQGAGRVRQLGRNQKLWMSSTIEVRNSVLQLRASIGSQPSARPASTGTIGIVDVLNWVVENTQQQCTLGLLEWAQNGLQFYAKEVDRANELQDDDWMLESQYGGAQTDELIYDVIRERLDQAEERNAAQIEALPVAQADEVDDVFNQIDDRAFAYGYENEVHVSSYGEECERELQVEEEEEVQAEEKAPPVTPASEIPWNVSAILTAKSATEVKPGSVFVYSLADIAASYLRPERCGRDIAWNLMKVYEATNFWFTILRPGGPFSGSTATIVWNGYLRLIDVLVIFHDGTLLALTEMDADALLAAIGTKIPSNIYIVNLRFACSALAEFGANCYSNSIPLSIGSSPFGARLVPVLSIIGCCLYNGDTHFISDKQEELTKNTLQQLLKPLRRRESHCRRLFTPVASRSGGRARSSTTSPSAWTRGLS